MIYFIQTESGQIKIGQTKNLELRLQMLQTGSCERLKIIFAMDGGRAEEKEIHTRFQKFHLRGEWFHPDQSIFDFINSKDCFELCDDIPQPPGDRCNILCNLIGKGWSEADFFSGIREMSDRFIKRLGTEAI